MTAPLTVDDRELIERLERSATEANFLVGSVVQICVDRGVGPLTNKPRLQDGGVSEIAVDILEAIDRLQSLLSDRDKLVSALERLDRNFDLLLAGKPVRDVAETKAETRAALTQTEVP